LAKAEEKNGASEWIVRTHLAMSPEERRTNRLVIIGFYYAITPAQSWPSFPAYIAYLESLPGESMRERMLQKYASLQIWNKAEDGECTNVENPEPLIQEPDLDQVLASSKSYLAFLRRHFGESHIDENLELQAYHYAIDPPKMKALILNHLRWMWEKYLAEEWERVRPALSDSVNAFRQVDLSAMTPLEAAGYITGQELDQDKWAAMLENARELIFVPSMHIGPYLWHWGEDDRHHIVFGARLPPGLAFEAPDLSRAEIIVRLSALADDSRLRILRSIAENGEQRAQDLIQMVDLSQSAVSRHLQQLTATGYLSERRCEGGKCYQLNPERVSDTLHAVEMFLKIHPRNLLSTPN
jgi:DNA-binding transcriptional ArsR family regulator